MSADQNVQLIQKIYTAFGQGDIPTILSHLDKNVRWEVVAGDRLPWGQPAHNPDQVGQFFMTLNQHLDYQQFEPIEYIAQGNRVVVLGRDRRVVRANGHVIDTSWVMLWTLHGDTVSTFDYFDDSDQVLRALNG